jgi:hypothetical protein
LTDGIIDHMDTFSLRQLVLNLGKVCGSVVDDVLASRFGRSIQLRRRANGTADSNTGRACPPAQNLTDAASRAVHADGHVLPHLPNPVQNVVRS